MTKISTFLNGFEIYVLRGCFDLYYRLFVVSNFGHDDFAHIFMILMHMAIVLLL